jgi:hypothetical protein
MSNLSTLPKGDSAWLLRKAIERIIKQISVLETNIGSSTTGNSANTQVIFNDNGVLRGDAGLTYNAATDLLSVGSATITGALTVGTGANSAVQKAAILGGYTVFENSAGTGNPSITFNNDIDTGIRNPAANTLVFDAGGFEQYRIAALGVFTWADGAGGTRMTLNSTGLGVGGSPSSRLDVANSGTPVVFSMTLTGAQRWQQIIDTSVGNWTLRDQTGSKDVLICTAGSGNVGVGVTPSAWGSNSKALQVGSGSGAVSSTGAGITSTRFTHGCYFDNTNWKYQFTGVGPSLYELTGANGGSTHAWYVSAGGTAGNAITFTQAMTLDASGNLLVGTTAAGGSASNSAKSVAGFFSTVNGTTASTASGSAVTMFASPNEATFIVSAYIFGTGSPAAYNAVAIVKVSGGVATVTTISSSTSMAISVSGLNVQATQTSGSAQVIVYSAIRIS